MVESDWSKWPHMNGDSTFEQIILSQEEECRRATIAAFGLISKEVQTAKLLFDQLLQHLYRFSSCHWGCHGGEHVFEYIAGRAVTSLICAIRLADSGYYDESLGLVRGAGESANLLNLFLADTQHVRKWIDSPENTRKTEYGPSKVRKMLNQMDALVPYKDAHYSSLCRFVHPNPTTTPQSHNASGLPSLGAVFQQNGYVRCTWEAAWALCAVSGPMSKLAVFPEDQAMRMVNMTVELSTLAFEHSPYIESQ